MHAAHAKYAFHASIHARAAEVVEGGPITLLGEMYRVLQASPPALGEPFACSFEEAAAALAGLERLFCEPDGAFVWASPTGEPAWQVEGVLYDRDGRLLFVDVKGDCPASEFDRLLAALGSPRTPLMYQLSREAVFLDEAEFRRWATAKYAAR